MVTRAADAVKSFGKTNVINTSFITNGGPEETFSRDCRAMLDALSVSIAYPDLNELAVKTLETWKIFDDLLQLSRTDKRSQSTTADKLIAKQNLIYEIHLLIWDVQRFGNNDPLKMTKDTGLTLVGPRAHEKPIETAPESVKTGPSIPFDPNTGTVSLPVTFKKGQGRPSGVRGASYRIKPDGATQWAEPMNFPDNRNRRIDGLRKGDKGLLQVRFNGGTKGNGPWSDAIEYFVS